MAQQLHHRTTRRAGTGARARARLVATMPVVERRIRAAGISTAVLEGGEGPPMVLLHGPGEYAAKWLRVISDLVTTHRVVAPDLPGHGASEAPDGGLDGQQTLAWLAHLIAQTCATPPVLVGLLVGGAIAARFAARHDDALSHLVLVDALGLAPFQPAPRFESALSDWIAQPSEDTHDRVWRQCAFDLDALRDRMGETWGPFADYNLDRARTPAAQRAMHDLLQHFGFAALPTTELERIRVATTLIWGRQDLATSLRVAQAASARLGWPLFVIDDCGDDPPIEQPTEFVAAVQAALRA